MLCLKPVGSGRFILNGCFFGRDRIIFALEALLIQMPSKPIAKVPETTNENCDGDPSGFQVRTIIFEMILNEFPKLGE